MKTVGNRIPTLVGVKLDSSDIKEGIDALAASDKFVVFYGSKMVKNSKLHNMENKVYF